MIRAYTGSREYPDEQAVREDVRSLHPGSVVAVGAWWSYGKLKPTRGVDEWAADEANRMGLTVCLIAGSEVHGKAAGLIRNPVIVQIGDEVKAFWDGQSKGTKHTMDIAKKAGKLRPEDWNRMTAKLVELAQALNKAKP